MQTKIAGMLGFRREDASGVAQNRLIRDQGCSSAVSGHAGVFESAGDRHEGFLALEARGESIQVDRGLRNRLYAQTRQKRAKQCDVGALIRCDLVSSVRECGALDEGYF